MKINAHVHISIFENNAKNLEESFVLLLKDMKNNYIDCSIVIPDNIEKSPDVADLEMVRKLTEGKDSFFILGSPQIVQRGDSEINKYKKLIENKTIRGIKFFPGHDPYYPTDKRCLAYYALCEKFNVPALFHTGENSNNSECAKWNDPKYIVEIAKEYPKLKVVIAHYYWPQIDYCYQITKNISNIYFDIAAMADDEVIKKSGGVEKVLSVLKKTINDGDNKVIFGTDWPICSTEDHINLIKSLNLDKETEDKIFYKNAIKIYNLPL